MEDGNAKPEILDAAELVESTADGSAVVEAKAASMIVVLSKRENSVRSTVTFLERRGFSARYVASLNEAVELFANKEANKLLLSVNFQHPKVEMLPVLMNQSFKIETILFAEENDRKTQNKLSHAKTKHVLFGPVSGPVVMMKIRQIDRELNGEADESTPSRASSSKDEDNDIKIGGRKGSNEDTVVLNGKTQGKDTASLENLLRELADEGRSETPAAENLARSGDTYVQKGDRSKMKSASGDESPEDETGAVLSARAQNLRAGLDRGLTEAPARGRLIIPIAFKRARNARSFDDLDALDADAALEGLGTADTVATRAPEAAARASSVKVELTDAEKQALPTEEKFRRCLQEALAIVSGAPRAEINQLNGHAKAALISLRTSQFNCAFVVSLNFARQTAGELFHRVEISFFSLLRDHGVEFDNDQVYSIYLDNMNIVREAFAASEFSVVTSTNEIEMGAAKVFVSNPVAQTEPYEENMHAISLREVPLNAPVTFDLFLHFKRNAKFLRYLKKGSSISDDQVSRLESRNALGLVEKTDVEAYRRHYAAYAINVVKKPA